MSFLDDVRLFFRQPILNPFREVYEVSAYPLARVYRTSLMQKFRDTFRVFSGYGLVAPEDQLYVSENHLGLYDYFTLGLGTLLAKGVFVALEISRDAAAREEETPFGVKIGQAGLFLLGGISHGLRYLTSGILTLVTSPFVVLAHLLTMKKREELMTTVKNMSFTAWDPFTHAPVSTTIGAEFDKAHTEEKISEPTEEVFDLDYLSTHTKVRLALNPKFSPYNPNRNPKIKFKEEEIKKRLTLLPTQPLDLAIFDATPEYGISKEEAARPTSVVQAMIELNLGNLAQKLEMRGFFQSGGRDKIMNTQLPVVNEEPAPTAP